jgi:hypothetical protein
MQSLGHLCEFSAERPWKIRLLHFLEMRAIRIEQTIFDAAGACHR